MNEACNRVIVIRLLPNEIATNQLYTKIVPPADVVIIVSMEIIVGDLKGTITFCVPYAAIKPLADRFSGGYRTNENYGKNNKSTDNITSEIKELRHTLLEFKDNFVTDISGILKEIKNVSEKKALEQVQNQETELTAILTTAVKNRIEDVVELIHIYLEQGDGPKVAAFLIALGSELSVEIFKLLREDEIELLTFEIAKLDRIGCKHKIAILKEFYEYLEANQSFSSGGIDYARVLLEKSIGDEKAVEIINRLTESLQIRPFDFIRKVDPQHFLNFIQQEHPQIIALVLSYLEPTKSAIILQNLPHELQAGIIIRILAMSPVSSEILQKIAAVLEKKLLSLAGEDYCRAGGVESAVEILKLVDPASKTQIVESVYNEDPEIAEEISKRFTAKY
jgi:DNA-binding transcriptional ArsR family regulator